MQTFAERLEHAMKVRGLSAAQFARLIKVVPGAVSGWLSDKRPSRKNLEQIAQALEVSASWLEHGEGEPPVDAAAVDGERKALGWRFRDQPPDGQRVLGEAASSSFDPDLNILSRETNQNIGDSRHPSEKTVFGTFTLERLRGKALERFLAAMKFDELREHLEGALAVKHKGAPVIRQALKQLDEKGELLLLRIEDVNGVGLIGEEYGVGNYAALVRNVMDTLKADGAAGSHGLGKSTIQRSSAFSTLLFSSNLSEPEPEGDGQLRGRTVGRVSLPWHEACGEEWAGPGWFGIVDPDPIRKGARRSAYLSAPLLDELRLTRPPATGATVLVVGLHDPSGEHTDPVEMAREIGHSAAENFFAALLKYDEEPPRMQTRVRVAEVADAGSEKVLHDEVVDPKVQMAPLVDLLQKAHDLQTVNQLLVPGDVTWKDVELTIPRRFEAPTHNELTHRARLLVRLASADEASHPYVNSVILMRGPLMRVRVLRPRGLGAGARPYFAILQAGEAANNNTNDKQAELFLRAAEPPSHEQWKLTPEVGASYAKGAKARLSEFEKKLLEVLRDAVTVSVNEESDGPQALRELLQIRRGPDPSPQRPRVVAPVRGAVRADGAWEITEATIQLPPKSKAWSVSPVLKFGTETGGGLAVGWQSLEAISDCTVVDGNRLLIKAGARRARWRGVSDPATHPVAARDAVALVDIQRVTEQED